MQHGVDDSLGSAVREAVRVELAPLIEDLRRFVDRRIAELSAEVHATVQLVDYSETNLSGQLARIHEQVATLLALPTAASRNSGMELEAVVEATESAANRIMEAAETITDALQSGQCDPAVFAAVSDKVNAIFEACTFQDLTGQRIRRAIDHLRHVETMLTELMPEGEAPEAAAPGPEPPGDGDPDLAQDAVDQLFAEAAASVRR